VSRRSGGFFDLPGKRARLAELEPRLTDPALWDDPRSAGQVTKEAARLKAAVEEYDRLRADLGGLAELLEIADEADAAALEVEREAIEGRIEKLYRDALFRGEHAELNAILTVKPGAGGTESCDWAEMLFRMYRRWAERHGLKVEVIDVAENALGGITDGTMIIRGERVFGLLHTENGVHRLVRISPFDAQSRRHTSFASVEVLPEIDDSIDIRIDPAELRIDVMRSSGHGGQGVNTTDSAVRLVHLPTGMIVSCQNTRSQVKNREFAMQVLRSRLYERELRRRREEQEKARGEQKEIAWGSQIRSYVLHPYQLVKDHRNNFESHQPDRVLDGDLDEFLYKGLEWEALQNAN